MHVKSELHAFDERLQLALPQLVEVTRCCSQRYHALQRLQMNYSLVYRMPIEKCRAIDQPVSSANAALAKTLAAARYQGEVSEAVFAVSERVISDNMSVHELP